MANRLPEKTALLKPLQQHDRDTGSAPVQIAILTGRINHLSAHFKAHRKDVHSRQGLLMMVSHRRRLLEYLKRHDEDKYRKVLETLDLRK